MWYWIFRFIFIAFFKTLFRFKVSGLEYIPTKTNFIIVANHTSFLDALCVMAAAPTKIFCVAARYLYRSRFLHWFLYKTEAFPTGSSAEKGEYLLLKNKNVGIFPEGGCSRDGKLKQFKRGAALLAIKTGRPIVPAAILGAFEAFPRKKRFPRFFTPITVKFGRAIYLLKEFDDIVDSVYLQEGTMRLRNAVKGLIDEGR